ncbi:MAG: TonB-dependent receptor [Tannerellaceae bacterium]|nr:TonB-dependent receptor [Tannerellaceae bacterium]
MEERCNTFSLLKPSQRFLQMVIVATFLLVNCLPAMAQTGVRVTGVVTSDTDGWPLIGVNIIQKGTTNGTVTDFDGNFELTVPEGAVLDFSYIGYINQEITVSAGRTEYNVVLREDSQALDEVVVIGYGVQKKKLVTGATVQVKGDEIQKLSTTSVLGALQSQSPGVNITQSSGMPGENFKVTVRGLGTVGNASPLYVIDGIAGGDINTLNPSDIESIDVLKDAASAAIYGARAANGVILVTTKQGKAGKMQISYDGYVGFQNVYKMPSLLTASEYMMIVNEVNWNDGIELYDWATLMPDIYQQVQNGWQGTNWLEEMRNKNAPVQNHSINLTGGSEQSKFSLGFSYTSQEGILGKPVQPNYERYTARINSEHILLKGNNRDIITIGQNLNYTYSEKSGIGIGNIYWNDIHNALVAIPIMPAYNSEGEYYATADKEASGLQNFWAEAANPIALMEYERGQNKSKSYALNANAYITIEPVKDLRFKSTFGYRMNSSSYRSYTPTFDLSSTSINSSDAVQQTLNSQYSWTWENTLAYTFEVNNHSFDAVIGQSLEKWGMGEEIGATNINSIFNDFEHAWLSNTQGVVTGSTVIEGYPFSEGSLASFFGRINYNYKETYMASVVLRADGSSNFARGNRWGYFPSVSAGWVMTNEPFMESVTNWMDFFKIRASWGQNGNCDINPFQYLATVSFDDAAGYSFGTQPTGNLSTGGYGDILPNTDVTWETSEQLDLGFDARFLSGRLGVAFDWYKKTTKDWLVAAPQLASYGTGAPYINGGDVQNKGVEIALNWNDHVGDFTYGINLNLTQNKNEVTRIANGEGIIHGPENVLSQGTTEMYRAEVGYPIGYFWGYKTAGIFQNQAQIDEYRAAGNAVLDGAEPGDVIWVDTNGDGVITDDDKVMIGNPHPKVTMGLGLNFGYKGFDLSITATGAFGHQIAKSYRSFSDSRLQNYTTEIFGRWHGEGTSNKLPRLTSGSRPNWKNISDLYIENADYVKMQNITIGYDFKNLFPQMPLGQARLYFTAQNLFTITGYSGMDPEVGYSPEGSATDAYGNTTKDNWASGIDVGFYPSPRTFLVGVNLKF